MIGVHRLQGYAAALFQLLLEPVQALVIDGVFQACMLAFLAIAMIALQGYDALGDGDHLLRRHKSDQAAQPWVGGVIAMCGAHAPAKDRKSTRLNSSQ